MGKKRDLATPLATTPDFLYDHPDEDEGPKTRAERKEAREERRKVRKGKRLAAKSLKISDRLVKGKGKGVQPVQERHYNPNE
ncbi:MAG: hypothetical protein ACTSQK_10525 [Candidatus Heimdallarchaeota archaeon]